jgi:hypothetical protein
MFGGTLVNDSKILSARTGRITTEGGLMGRYNFDAVIFDLDGVVTKTALVHAGAWKKMFDDYLKEREKRYQSRLRNLLVNMIIGLMLTENRDIKELHRS